MCLIRKTFKGLEIFRKLFKSLLQPHLEYATAVWNPYLEKDITAIENVQRRVTKQIPGMKDRSYEERLKELKLPTLKYQRARGEVYRGIQDIKRILR